LFGSVGERLHGDIPCLLFTIRPIGPDNHSRRARGLQQDSRLIGTSRCRVNRLGKGVLDHVVHLISDQIT
jgi:hypothetical protein